MQSGKWRSEGARSPVAAETLDLQQLSSTHTAGGAASFACPPLPAGNHPGELVFYDVLFWSIIVPNDSSMLLGKEHVMLCASLQFCASTSSASNGFWVSLLGAGLWFAGLIADWMLPCVNKAVSILTCASRQSQKKEKAHKRMQASEVPVHIFHYHIKKLKFFTKLFKKHIVWEKVTFTKFHLGIIIWSSKL